MEGHKVDLREKKGKHNNTLYRKVIEGTQWAGATKCYRQWGEQEGGGEEKLGEETVTKINYNVCENAIWKPAY